MVGFKQVTGLTGKHSCDNCGAVIDSEDVCPIEDFFQRVEPGGMVPSGECPECGALCYPIKEEEGDDADSVPSEGVHEERGGS